MSLAVLGCEDVSVAVSGQGARTSRRGHILLMAVGGSAELAPGRKTINAI